MIVEMMMAKDARDRYQNASQLLEDLDAAIAGREPVHARPTEGLVASLETSPEQVQDAPVPVLPGAGGPNWAMIGLGVLLLASALLNAFLFLRR